MQPDPAGTPPASPPGWARPLFLVAALYDGIAGVAFFVFFEAIFDAVGVETSGRGGYIQLSAAFVAVQGLGYWFVYRNPLRNIDLVKVGVAYKAAYSGVAYYYAAKGELPHELFLVFASLDLVFLAAFVAFVYAVRRPAVVGRSTG